MKKKQIVPIEWIEYLQEERKKINKMDIRNIKFFKNGEEIKIDKEIIKDFEFIGLSTVDFINSGFYKKGFSEDD